MKNPLFRPLFLLSVIFLCSMGLKAQETSIMIRAQAKDAKFIGTSMGGAKIIVRNALTDEILAQGITEGSTGNTQKIVSEPQQRYEQITDGNTAGFLAKLDIKAPVFVTIEAQAPLNQEKSKITATTQLWVIPGKDILGDGIILEIPGFVVDVVSPLVHESIDKKNEIEIKARIVMMCGCPIAPDGLWDAEQYEVVAVVTLEGESVREIPLQVKGEASTFIGTTQLETGSYEVMVYAFDPVTGNTGLDKTNFAVN